MEVPASAASAVPAALGGSSFLLGGLFALVVTGLAVAVGFTIVPLDNRNPIADAARRLAAGLFCSFTLGPIAAFKVFGWFPGYLEMWQRLLPDADGHGVLWPYLAAAAPVLAVCALLGFWLVAALVHYFVKRTGKDLGEMARDMANDVRAVAGGQ